MIITQLVIVARRLFNRSHRRAVEAHSCLRLCTWFNDASTKNTFRVSSTGEQRKHKYLMPSLYTPSLQRALTMRFLAAAAGVTMPSFSRPQTSDFCKAHGRGTAVLLSSPTATKVSAKDYRGYYHRITAGIERPLARKLGGNNTAGGVFHLNSRQPACERA